MGIERGKWRRTEDYIINADDAIESMVLREIYKYRVIGKELHGLFTTNYINPISM